MRGLCENEILPLLCTQKAFVIRERHSSRHFVEFKDVLVRVKGKFVSTRLWSLDNDPKQLLIVDVERLETTRLCERTAVAILFTHLSSVLRI
jgi:hypothetical protein